MNKLQDTVISGMSLTLDETIMLKAKISPKQEKTKEANLKSRKVKYANKGKEREDDIDFANIVYAMIIAYYKTMQELRETSLMIRSGGVWSRTLDILKTCGMNVAVLKKEGFAYVFSRLYKIWSKPRKRMELSRKLFGDLVLLGFDLSAHEWIDGQIEGLLCYRTARSWRDAVDKLKPYIEKAKSALGIQSEEE